MKQVRIQTFNAENKWTKSRQERTRAGVSGQWGSIRRLHFGQT